MGWEILLTSGLTVAIWKTIESVLMWLLNRRAKKSDSREDAAQREESRINQRFADIEEKLDLLTAAQKVNTYDRIKYLCRSHIRSGEISYEDREDIVHMHESYSSLGGNGHLDAVMKEVMNLPLKRS